MLLDISKAIKYPGQSFGYEFDTQFEEMDVLDDPVTFTDVRVEGEYSGSPDVVTVKGDAVSTVITRCSRCMDQVSFLLRAAFKETYFKEKDPDDPDARQLEGREIDLDDPVREALLHEMPMKVLCSEDCKGLCPVCGVNRNHELCTCQEGSAVLNPFSALSGMLSDNEEV